MKKITRIITGLLALVLAFCVSGCATTQKHYKVYVVCKETTSAFWQSVRAGAQVAANENHAEMVFCGAANEEDYEGQNALIEDAVNNGADAIVFSAISTTASNSTVESAFSRGVKFVTIDSDFDSQIERMKIGTDEYGAGVSACEALADGLQGDINVAIINFNAITGNGQQRQQGFTAAAQKNDRVNILEVFYAESNKQDAKERTKEAIAKYPQLNAIVTFNEWTTLGVGAAIEESGRNSDIYAVGFDSHPVSVGHLENGILDVLIVQSPYSMGYLGVENALATIKGEIKNYTKIDTRVAVVTSENMYSVENQGFLFPFS